MTPAELDAYCRVMRANGVRRFVLDALVVELFPPTVEASGPSTLNLEDAVPKCKCGHDETDHNGQGYCLKGCAPAQCADKK